MMYRQESQRTPDSATGPTADRAIRLILIGGDKDELGVISAGLMGWGLEVENTTFDRFTWPLDKAFDVALACMTKPGPAPEQAVQLIKSQLGIPLLALVPITAVISSVARLSADDIAFLPVGMEELKARVDLLVAKARQRALGYPFLDRRRSPDTWARRDGPAVFSPRKGEQLMVIDREKKVIVCGQLVRLSPKPYKLLRLLASDPGRVFSIREISAHLWPKKPPQRADIQQCVHLLRIKIEEDPRKPSWVKTIPGFGYKLNRPVQR